MKFKHFLQISFFFVFLVQCKTLTKSNLQQAQESSTFQVENDSIHKSSVEDAYEKMQSKYLETKLLDKSQVLQTLDLKVSTLNFGLIDKKLLGGFVHVWVPHKAKRASLMPIVVEKFLKKENPAVLMGQEFWEASDLQSLKDHFKESGLDKNYSIYPKSADGLDSRGLMMIVDNSQLKTNVEPYFKKITRATLESVGGFERGLLVLSAKHSSGIKVLVVNTHLTPVVDYTSASKSAQPTRIKQIQESHAFLASQKDSHDFIVFGGDLNTSPEFINAKKSEKAVFDANVLPYLKLARNPKFLVDSYRIANPNETGFTWDRRKNLNTFWNKDKNEPEQRYDHLFVGSANELTKFEIMDSKLSFTESMADTSNASGFGEPSLLSGVYDVTPMINGKEPTMASENGKVDPAKSAPIHVSDHFGITTSVRVFKIKDFKKETDVDSKISTLINTQTAEDSVKALFEMYSQVSSLEDKKKVLSANAKIATPSSVNLLHRVDYHLMGRADKEITQNEIIDFAKIIRENQNKSDSDWYRKPSQNGVASDLSPMSRLRLILGL